MNYFLTFLINASKYGIWDIISVGVLLVSFILAIRYLWFPVSKVSGLNFFMTHIRDDSPYPSKLIIEIRNFTNKNIVLSNTYFIPNGLQADPNARGDSILKKYEIKFPPSYSSPDYLLLSGQIISTWFPIDPLQSDDNIKEIKEKHCLGKFVCKCTFLEKRLRTVRLIRKF